MIDLIQWQVFVLIFVRVSSFFVTLPFLSYRGVPNLMKIFFGLVVSYLIYLSGGYGLVEVPEGSAAYILYIAGEAMVGLGLGFVVILVFSAFRMMGQTIDVKLGLSMASILDPQFGSTVTLMGQFFYLFSLVLYLSVNGHHHLFLALSRSYLLIPVGGASFSGAVLKQVTELFYGVFALAFQMAAPVIIVIIITDISLGLISKTVPQLQVFIVGLPLKIFLGLLVVYLSIPYLEPLIGDIFQGIYTDIFKIMGSLT
ncbi:flagellar biosynthetic protein FliR [Candidatus Contubernalis alkaliaceticus]|uniref:flagellar biosynthetic protein FliR n=1 Tax=Candidatus Contubernalis alkaliaceticus TaxID=338645 RepID=UPI001F4C1320|nr:flagellar biosynthetic protein FliR [Candidatus Contubernalis alkalaceticus]UNC91759.1 flagellar type III secretion system protein FliR [Candidatus Contubernalis alkalaceticus]